MQGISPLRSRPAWIQVLLGGVIIAVADMVLAITYWFSWDAAGLTKLFQVVASGILGAASKQNGTSAALLGAGLHLLMATMFVVAYALASRRWPVLLAKPIVYGCTYGIGLFVVMNFVVVPLSNAPPSPALSHVSWVIWNIAMNLLFGIVCVVFSRRALLR